MKHKVSINDLKNEIRIIRKNHPALKDDSAFIYWFLISYLVDSEEIALSSLTGKAGGKGGEKNIDAIYIDVKYKQCNIIQGKFHLNESYREKRNDVLNFASLVNIIWGKKQELEAFFNGLDAIAKDKIKEVVHLVRERRYELNLFYVTTGHCAKGILDEANSIVRRAAFRTEIFIITQNQVLNIFEKCYLEGIAPAYIPTFKIRIISEGTIQHEGVMHRYDPNTKIESWVFSASGRDIAQMYARAGDRLFAKNIRGYLGSTDINESIAQTIRKEPSNFWYYNNGVTIVCDEARREERCGEDAIIINGAQIINGQQTTITLYNNDSKDTNILVKIIKIPKEINNYQDYDKLVNSIVRATNWQNKINPSDLVSNDYIQVYLEREMRKVGYQYIRKRMNKIEAKRILGQGYIQIKKEEIAQAVGACLFDPVIVRKGKERLFEDPYYKSVFSNRDPFFYLTKYWLTRIVQYTTRGYPERAYAKWVVINFLWNELRNLIEKGKNNKKFCYINERYDHYNETLRPLYSAINDIFRAVLKYYRLNRGHGEEAKDISTFFQMIKLHIKFKKYWDSNKNSYRNVFQNKILKFKKYFNKIDIYN